MKVQLILLISFIVATSAIKSATQEQYQGDVLVANDIDLVEKKRRQEAGPSCKPTISMSDDHEAVSRATQARRNLRDLRDQLHENNRQANGQDPQGALYTKDEEGCVSKMPTQNNQKRRQ